jgi:hypothetical protein
MPLKQRICIAHNLVPHVAHAATFKANACGSSIVLKTSGVHVQGYRDARLAGQKIKEHVGDKPLFIYTSPYLRTKQVSACRQLF